MKGLGRRVTWSRSILKGQVKKKGNQTGGSTQNKLEWGVGTGNRKTWFCNSCGNEEARRKDYLERKASVSFHWNRGVRDKGKLGAKDIQLFHLRFCTNGWQPSAEPALSLGLCLKVLILLQVPETCP